MSTFKEAKNLPEPTWLTEYFDSISGMPPSEKVIRTLAKLLIEKLHGSPPANGDEWSNTERPKVAVIVHTDPQTEATEEPTQTENDMAKPTTKGGKGGKKGGKGGKGC